MDDLLNQLVEQPLCTLCGSSDTRRFSQGEYHLNLLPPLGVVRCRNCSLLFLSPRPGRKLREALMSGEVPPSLRPYCSKPAAYASVTPGRAELFERRLTTLAEIAGVRPTSRPTRLLDIGASSGTLVQLAMARGWEARGIEASAEGVRCAEKQGLPVIRGFAESLPFADESFDIVHSHHVFEHLADPLRAAREAWRVLSPGGSIFLEVPNQMDNISFRRDILLNRVPRRERNIRSIHHLWFFSRKTLRLLLERSGFVGVQIDDEYLSPPKGLRASLSIVMQTVGRLAYGGPLLQGCGFKSSEKL
jgi:SAM-dependent methyltransferase